MSGERNPEGELSNQPTARSLTHTALHQLLTEERGEYAGKGKGHQRFFILYEPLGLSDTLNNPLLDHYPAALSSLYTSRKPQIFS